ncbi:hypothetical protein ACGGKE_17225 (plasmid) [Sphingobium naphthae]|uniref:hypothetical protein n=1 Tax=Sphingobium naphthae TaxID=1886786 RepID=UPI000C8AE46A|nr:hypothetical protein [Erythrobacter sp.]|tara:strand:- start:1918 stop:2112 length:195 start_codon:yes stop_codon:yes gene_type:complete
MAELWTKIAGCTDKSTGNAASTGRPGRCLRESQAKEVDRIAPEDASTALLDIRLSADALQAHFA